MPDVTKHTPGPWYVDPFGLDIDVARENFHRGALDPESSWTAVAVAFDESDPCGAGTEHVAYCHPDNAAIISAAPDMYGLLASLATIGETQISAMDIGLARDVIRTAAALSARVVAKARGDTTP